MYPVIGGILVRLVSVHVLGKYMYLDAEGQGMYRVCGLRVDRPGHVDNVTCKFGFYLLKGGNCRLC